MSTRGYDLVRRLDDEANEVAREDRAQLMRDAAREIERLIQDWRAISDELERLKRRFEAKTE